MDKQRANYVIKIAMENQMPLQLSRLLACHSAFETANWTNNNFLKNNNGYGYKFVLGAKLQLPKEGIHSTESDHYAAYATFEDSIKEVCLWIGRRVKESKFPKDLTIIQMPEQYAFLLKSCGYYGGKETDYAKGIAIYLEKLSEEINT